MEKNRTMLTWMVLLTIAAFGVVSFAFIHGVPMLAVLVSFSSVVINYNIRARITTYTHD